MPTSSGHGEPHHTRWGAWERTAHKDGQPNFDILNDDRRGGIRVFTCAHLLIVQCGMDGRCLRGVAVRVQRWPGHGAGHAGCQLGLQDFPLVARCTLNER